MTKALEYAKAIAGGLYAALMVLIPVVDDGLTRSEGLYAFAAFLVGAGLVAAIPNKTPAA